jgi:hypothetical protein
LPKIVGRSTTASMEFPEKIAEANMPVSTTTETILMLARIE